MSNEISLKETERKVFQTVFQNGLLDIAIGGFLLVFAIGPFLTPYLGDLWGTVAIFLPLWGILFPALWLIRKRVVTPRVGSVKYGPWRVSRMMRFNLVIFVVLVFTAILGFLSAVEFDAVPGWIHTARFSLVFLLVFSVAGYFLNFARLYIYGILIALAPLIGELLYQNLSVPHHGWPVTFGLASGLITLKGLILFVRFLRDHPLQPGQTESIEWIE
jgi:MFS family permease